MKANNRIYSIPYNGTNPEWFLQEVEKRKKIMTMYILSDNVPKKYWKTFNSKIRITRE